jgi:hypothetical protein
MANTEQQLLSVVHSLMREVHTVNNGQLALHVYNRPKKDPSALHSYIIRGDIALLQRGSLQADHISLIATSQTAVSGRLQSGDVTHIAAHPLKIDYAVSHRTSGSLGIPLLAMLLLSRVCCRTPPSQEDSYSGDLTLWAATRKAQ